MIGKQYQGKGYGKQAALEFLDDFHRSHSDDPLFISVSLENTVARKMYSDIGFQEVKEVEYFFLQGLPRDTDAQRLVNQSLYPKNALLPKILRQQGVSFI